MSKAVPSKMLAMAETMGADSFRDITVERVKLQPIGVNSATSYTPNALNKIHFRIPAYSASFLDNSRTFLSFTVQTTGDDLTATHCAVFGNGLPVFNRMVVKSSNGLVLEDCSQFHLLTRLFTILSTEEDYRIQEGVYSDGDPTVTVGAQLLTGLKYTIQFNSGLLDKKLKSFLPLFMMDSSYALDVELYLSSPAECTPPCRKRRYYAYKRVVQPHEPDHEPVPPQDGQPAVLPVQFNRMRSQRVHRDPIHNLSLSCAYIELPDERRAHQRCIHERETHLVGVHSCVSDRVQRAQAAFQGFREAGFSG
jgi:hypothetical protein